MMQVKSFLQRCRGGEAAVPKRRGAVSGRSGRSHSALQMPMGTVAINIALNAEKKGPHATIFVA